MNLKKKLEYEFQCFYLDQMRTSKENIFAHSAEIEMKKQLVKELKQLLENPDEQTECFLMLQNNLLESAYVFLKDVKEEQSGEDMKAALKSWLVFVSQKNK